MKKIELNVKENEIVIVRFAKQTKAIRKKTNRLPRLDCVKSCNDKKINVCKEASCDGLQTKFIETNIRGSILSECCKTQNSIRAEASCDGLQTKFIETNIRGSILSECCKTQNSIRAEASCDGFVGFQVRKRENRTYSPLSESARRIPQIRARGNRAGFGMMFAIIITILVATLGVLAVKFSTQTLNTTTNEYIAIQLDLYLNSTAELAVLYVQRNGFVCNENIDCNLSKNGTNSKRANVTEPIEKYIAYGENKEYSFKYKITPLDNYDRFDTSVYQDVSGDAVCNETQGAKRCFKEETKNAFVLDISGSVTNPITNQTLRVTKRQIIKP